MMMMEKSGSKNRLRINPAVKNHVSYDKKLQVIEDEVPLIIGKNPIIPIIQQLTTPLPKIVQSRSTC